MGDEFLERIEGMFAFVMWDERRARLIAARDRVGIKPLSYASFGRGVVLASEASPILQWMRSREPEPLALAYVMTLGYVPSPWSIWRNVRKLEAGHKLVWDEHNGIRTEPYWAPPDDIVEGEATTEEWSALFEEVLREHMMSDVPVALFLSGGLDSSAVAAGLGADGSLSRAITVSAPGNPYDEAPAASATAAHLQLPHQKVPVSVTDVDALITRVASSYDEPQAYSALLTMYRISEEAARDFKVVLSGDGGDELLAGYKWYENLDRDDNAQARLARKLLRPLARRNAPPLARRIAAAAFARTSHFIGTRGGSSPDSYPKRRKQSRRPREFASTTRRC